MFEWLPSPSIESAAISPKLLAIRLIAAALFGWLISQAYRWKRAGAWIPPTFPATLILLAILIAMVTQVVGDHIARAFSLVGALSIVRFRTVVEDTQDIAFVIFAVVVGMAVGAGDFLVATIGTCVVLGVLAASRLRRNGRATDWTSGASTLVASRLILRTGLIKDVHEQINQALRESIGSVELLGAETVRGGSAFEWTYRLSGTASCDPRSLVERLAAIDGVHAVDWKHTEH
jgi:uncharacterized membrane protein YhiD involved in acid resistance